MNYSSYGLSLLPRNLISRGKSLPNTSAQRPAHGRWLRNHGKVTCVFRAKAACQVELGALGDGGELDVLPCAVQSLSEETGLKHTAREGSAVPVCRMLFLKATQHGRGRWPWKLSSCGLIWLNTFPMVLVPFLNCPGGRGQRKMMMVTITVLLPPVIRAADVYKAPLCVMHCSQHFIYFILITTQ